MEQEIKWPGRTAIDATLVSAFTAILFASLLHWARINEWEPYVWTTALCFLLWPLWYSIVIPKMKSDEPRSWKRTFWTAIIWLVLFILHGLRLKLHRPFADQIGVGIEVLAYLSLSIYYFYLARSAHHEQSSL